MPVSSKNRTGECPEQSGCAGPASTLGVLGAEPCPDWCSTVGEGRTMLREQAGPGVVHSGGEQGSQAGGHALAVGAGCGPGPSTPPAFAQTFSEAKVRLRGEPPSTGEFGVWGTLAPRDTGRTGTPQGTDLRFWTGDAWAPCSAASGATALGEQNWTGPRAHRPCAGQLGSGRRKQWGRAPDRVAVCPSLGGGLLAFLQLSASGASAPQL